MATRKRGSLAIPPGGGTPHRSTATTSRYRLGVTLAVVALACICFVTAAAARTDAAKSVLTIGWVPTDSAQGFNPAKRTGGPLVDLPLAYAPLIHWNRDGSYGQGGLATSWRYIKDPAGPNKGFELTLRRDARFSDGTPVTAQAVKTSLEYFQSAKGPWGSSIGTIRSIETIGKWKVRLHVASPNPILPNALSEGGTWGFIVNPKAVAKVQAEQKNDILGTSTAGAGPYALDPSQSVPGDHATFVPNKYYYDKGSVRWSKIVFRYIAASTTMLQALKTGQLDAALLDSTVADAAKAAGFNLSHSGLANATDGLFILDKSGALSKPLGDVRVRQALNYAIDRKAITSALFGDLGTPTSEWITTDGWDPKYQNHYPYNPTKAKSLLAAAGYPDGFTLNMLSGNFAGNLLDPMTQAIAKYFNAIGIKTKITVAGPSDWFGQGTGGTFPVWTVPRGGDPMWLFYGLFLKPGSLGTQHGGDPVIDKLWLKGQRAKNAASYWKQMSARMVETAAFVPVVNQPTFSVGYAKHIVGADFPESGPNLIAGWSRK
jgi:peptide/nickel transport system substrate-binding protein